MTISLILMVRLKALALCDYGVSLARPFEPWPCTAALQLEGQTPPAVHSVAIHASVCERRLMGCGILYHCVLLRSACAE